MLSGCSAPSEKEIDQFCRDLNVLLLHKSVIKGNILNLNTTRTPDGGPYIPKRAINCKDYGGCEIVPLKCIGVGCDSKAGQRGPILKYEPRHPDANKSGYVAYPNIILAEEQEKLNQVEMGIKLLLESKPVPSSFFFSKEANKYFKKYQAFDSSFNFRKLIN